MLQLFFSIKVNIGVILDVISNQRIILKKAQIIGLML